MTTLEEVIENLELPSPVVIDGNGEDFNGYVRRIAYIGALAGKQHALTHSPPAIVKIPFSPSAPESTDFDDDHTPDA